MGLQPEIEQIFNEPSIQYNTCKLFQKNFFSLIFPNDADITCLFLGPSSNLRPFSYPNALDIFLPLIWRSDVVFHPVRH